MELKVKVYPLGLLQLLVELLHHLAVLLPQLLDLGFMVTSLLLHGLLQRRHLLLALRPDGHRENISRTSRQYTELHR